MKINRAIFSEPAPMFPKFTSTNPFNKDSDSQSFLSMKSSEESDLEIRSVSPIRKLSFGNESNCTNSTTTELPETSLVNLFLRRDKKYQSDNVALHSLRKKSEFDNPDIPEPINELPLFKHSQSSILSKKYDPRRNSTNAVLFNLNLEENEKKSLYEIPEIQKQDDNDDVSFDSQFSNKLSLSTSKNIRDPDLHSISPQVLANILHQEPSPSLHYLVIDCRYEYEFHGGHIKDAINVTSPEILEQIFFTYKHLLYSPQYLRELKADPVATLAKASTYVATDILEIKEPQLPMLIFHCEFSQRRGPRAWRRLRGKDREINLASFPKLDYEEIYVLDGGYVDFYSQFPELCDGDYVRMNDKKFKEQYSEAKEISKKLWCKKPSITST